MSPGRRRYIDHAFLVAITEGPEAIIKFLGWAQRDIGPKRWRHVLRYVVKAGLVTHTPNGGWVVTTKGLRAIGR